MKTFCFPFQNCLLFSKFPCISHHQPGFTKIVLSFKIHQFSGHSLRHLRFHLKTNRKLFRFRKPKPRSKSKSKWDLIIHIRFLSPRGECCIDRWFRFFLLHLNDPHCGCRLTWVFWITFIVRKYVILEVIMLKNIYVELIFLNTKN